MSSFPVTAANAAGTTLPGTTAVAEASTARNRILALLVALAVAVAVMAAPQFTDSASAHALPKTPASARIFARNMLHLLNAERRAHHLKPLQMDSKLIKSAHAHNVAMAKADEMSHQLPGEAFFADRISAAHYNWMAAGENIGWNSAMNRPGLRALERDMYNEKAPDNGHRLNILDGSFRNVGIDVYFDKKHNKMWFTQDFGQPA
jgi:uncharacterized protein YkwD